MPKNHNEEIIALIERIAKIRTNKKLSQRELSLRIGKNAGYIHMLETSKNFAPTYDTFLDILEVLEISQQQFFYEPVEEYVIDKEILTRLKKISPKKKDAVLTLLD